MSADARDQQGRAVTADTDGIGRSDGAKELAGAVTPHPRRREAATHHQTPAGGPVLPDITLQMGRSLSQGHNMGAHLSKGAFLYLPAFDGHLKRQLTSQFISRGIR
ncbi:hypothetical protein DPX16_12678 [Anabarilius grahami]|uniref:Uncharacterized protein n=1 Tax=Anabarilius grahami TaxID=495550 RepID=A0A3N0XTR5_ANAGA|nr:hypothetical protein DPX16_12678 [Anabarilius grahami]